MEYPQTTIPKFKIEGAGGGGGKVETKKYLNTFWNLDLDLFLPKLNLVHSLRKMRNENSPTPLAPLNFLVAYTTLLPIQATHNGNKP